MDPYGLYDVSANTAMQDVQSRGVHVNVSNGKIKPIHIGLKPDYEGGIKLTPEDPRTIQEKSPEEWKKIESSVNEFIDNPVSAKKLASVANDVKDKCPNNAAEYSHLERNVNNRAGIVNCKEKK